MNKNKNLAFTLAEVLIVIGIIGVVAALTLPNLNHATGDKETVTRLQKAYSILSEANDRAVAIYGPISTWESNEQCAENLDTCWMRRVGEFLKISKSCDETGDMDSSDFVNCASLTNNSNGMYIGYNYIAYQLSDNITFAANSAYVFNNCNSELKICFLVDVDVNGPNKGLNQPGYDTFRFKVSDSLGILPFHPGDDLEQDLSNCFDYIDINCSFWPIEYGNLDYLKADSSGQCNDSNIILDGVTNTSCH